MNNKNINIRKNTHIILSIVGYISIILIVLINKKIGIIGEKTKYANHTIEGLDQLIQIIILIHISITMLIGNILTGIMINKEKRSIPIIINMITLSTANLPIIVMIMIIILNTIIK